MRNEDVQDLVSKALRQAWQLGKTYWQQADSEYFSQHKKADATQAKFDELVEDIRAALAAVPADAPVVLPEPDEAVTEVIALVQSAMDSAMKAGERILEPDTFDEAFNEAKSKKSTIETNLRFLLATGGQAQANSVIDFPHEEVDALAITRYKVVAADKSMFWESAVVAGDGTRQLYTGRKVECENMARKFAGAFAEGAFVFHAMHAPHAQADAKEPTE